MPLAVSNCILSWVQRVKGKNYVCLLETVIIKRKIQLTQEIPAALSGLFCRYTRHGIETWIFSPGCEPSWWCK